MNEKEISPVFRHEGQLYRVVEEGSSRKVQKSECGLLKPEGLWFGTLDQELLNWSDSSVNPNLFLPAREMKLTVENAYTANPVKESSTFVWRKTGCRLIEYSDERGKRVQMPYKIEVKKFGPNGPKYETRWIDTYYNPDLFKSLKLTWEPWQTNMIVKNTIN